MQGGWVGFSRSFLRYALFEQPLFYYLNHEEVQMEERLIATIMSQSRKIQSPNEDSPLQKACFKWNNDDTQSVSKVSIVKGLNEDN